MNVIDRAIEAAFPGWALRRAYARDMLGTREIVNAHRGGLTTRLDRTTTKSRSYRGETRAERLNKETRRDKARRLYQEDPIGRSLLKTETDNVVSCGFTLESATDSEDFNKEAQARWSEWLEVADIRQMLCGVDLVRQFYLAPRRDGDGAIVLVDRGGESRLQYVPGDLIVSPPGKVGAENVLDGVEVDRTTRPVAFWVRDMDERGRDEYTRVSASNVVYLAPVLDNDLAVRGDSCYSQVFENIDRLNGFQGAVGVAARMAAVFGLIFKEDNGAKQIAGLGTLTNSQGNQQKAITLENGSLKFIGKDSDVVQVQAQQPMSQAPDWIRAECRIIGLPFDMPLELVCKDMSQVNFASARIGLIGYYRACRARQRAFVSRCLSRIYRWWISREVNLQRFVSAVPELYWLHKFMAEGWDYTDPVSEAQADLLQIDMGIKSPQMCAAERGRDYEAVLEQIAASRLLRRLAELPDIGSTYTRDRVEVEAADDFSSEDGHDQPAQAAQSNEEGDDNAA